MKYSPMIPIQDVLHLRRLSEIELSNTKGKLAEVQNENACLVLEHSSARDWLHNIWKENDALISTQFQLCDTKELSEMKMLD